MELTCSSELFNSCANVKKFINVFKHKCEALNCVMCFNI